MLKIEQSIKTHGSLKVIDQGKDAIFTNDGPQEAYSIFKGDSIYDFLVFQEGFDKILIVATKDLHTGIVTVFRKVFGKSAGLNIDLVSKLDEESTIFVNY